MRTSFAASASTLMMVATVANSDVSSVEACSYFLSRSGGIGPTSEAILNLLNPPEFSIISNALERYESYIANDVLWEFGELTEGEYRRLGAISASVLCEVDFIERRVLQIRLYDGPQVGNDTTNFRGDTRRVMGPTVEYIAVGEQVHKGKY